MSPKVDPIAARLAEVTARTVSGGTIMRVEALFGDRPAVKAEILRLRFEVKCSTRFIADLLTEAIRAETPKGQAAETISAAAVNTWCNANREE